MRARTDADAAAEAAELVARYPAISACRVALEPIDASAWNARVEVLLPEQQLIVNATGADQASARRNALARAAERLDALTARQAPPASSQRAVSPPSAGAPKPR